MLENDDKILSLFLKIKSHVSIKACNVLIPEPWYFKQHSPDTACSEARLPWSHMMKPWTMLPEIHYAFAYEPFNNLSLMPTLKFSYTTSFMITTHKFKSYGLQFQKPIYGNHHTTKAYVSSILSFSGPCSYIT